MDIDEWKGLTLAGMDEHHLHFGYIQLQATIQKPFVSRVKCMVQRGYDVSSCVGSYK